MLALATAAWAQDRYSPIPSSENPKLFVQPEQPPWPEPVPQQQTAQPEQQPVQPPETRENVSGLEENQPVNERQNVGGREVNNQEQRLFDQWNAPGQLKGGTASVRIVQ